MQAWEEDGSHSTTKYLNMLIKNAFRSFKVIRLKLCQVFENLLKQSLVDTAFCICVHFALKAYIFFCPVSSTVQKLTLINSTFFFSFCICLKCIIECIYMNDSDMQWTQTETQEVLSEHKKALGIG